MSGSRTGKVNGVVVADAGPLIGFAKADHLNLLKELYSIVWIPTEVHRELRPESNFPGATRLAEAITEGWLRVEVLADEFKNQFADLSLILDSGEAQAILLAEQLDCRFLLIDEKRGRRVAQNRGLPIAGTGALLIRAKRSGLIDAVSPVLDDLAVTGYRLSPALRGEIARLCGEST